MAVLQHHKHCSLAYPQCCHILFLFQIFASLPLNMSEQGRNSHWRGRDQPVHACIPCWRLAQGRTLIACPAPFQGMKEACFLPILLFCLLQKNFMNIKPYCCVISSILLEQNLTRAEGVLMDELFQTVLSVWYLAGRGKSDWGVLGTSYCWPSSLPLLFRLFPPRRWPFKCCLWSGPEWEFLTLDEKGRKGKFFNKAQPFKPVAFIYFCVEFKDLSFFFFQPPTSLQLLSDWITSGTESQNAHCSSNKAPFAL